MHKKRSNNKEPSPTVTQSQNQGATFNVPHSLVYVKLEVAVVSTRNKLTLVFCDMKQTSVVGFNVICVKQTVIFCER